MNMFNKDIISEAEENFVRERTSKSIQAWSSYLKRSSLMDFDLESFLPEIERGVIPGEDLPNIGFAASGGGHRAMLYSASILAALDGRDEASIDSGTGGILQLINYLSGLSGSVFVFLFFFFLESEKKIKKIYKTHLTHLILMNEKQERNAYKLRLVHL